jgi:transcriptional regulator with XRE-family HTH domain
LARPTSSAPVCERIRTRRQEAGLSCAALARLSGVSTAYISQIERGINGERPSAEFLARAARALGTSVDDLLGADPQPRQRDVPPSLAAFAAEDDIPGLDVEMLAGLHFRGQQPTSVAGWRFMFEAVKRSLAP